MLKNWSKNDVEQSVADTYLNTKEVICYHEDQQAFYLEGINKNEQIIEFKVLKYYDDNDFNLAIFWRYENKIKWNSL